jgi:hypothetical protein
MPTKWQRVSDRSEQEAWSIDRIHRGTRLTGELVARSREALQVSEKLLQQRPLVSPSERQCLRKWVED